MKSISAQEGARDRLSLRGEEWEVVVIVNTTSFIWFFD